MGKRWSDVKELFKKGHYQPLLLVYSCNDAKTIDITDAPTTDICESAILCNDLLLSVLSHWAQ